jgi:two-component system, NtrC family, response regulator AtoC
VGCVAISKRMKAAQAGELPPDEVIFGSTQAMRDIRRELERGATADVPLLLQGETGTGKEVLARFVHRCSGRTAGPFVKVNCPAVPGDLFESELFGHEKGSFTGAVESKPGQAEMARGGTLFLDEIGELDFKLQAKLLQLLQDGQFYRIGGQTERQSEARVVCATNRKLREAVRSGLFRQDLFYRISVLSTELPRLQDRKGDIPMLVAYFLEKYGRRYGRGVSPFSNSLLARLQECPWPGNIRQLENLVHRYVVFQSEQTVWDSVEDVERDPVPVEGAPNGSLGLKKFTSETVKELQRRIILEALDANGWHRGLAARALGISYGALLYKIKQAGLPLKRSRKRVSTSPLNPVKGTTDSREWRRARRGA